MFIFFEHAVCFLNILPFLLVLAKLIGDYFDNRQYSEQNLQYICAPNHRCVNRGCGSDQKKNPQVKTANKINLKRKSVSNNSLLLHIVKVLAY
jgi:hypothetical protein